jgi:hypothetical protein
MAEEIRADSYVGFDSITQQIEHKLLKRGFQFNVIVVGMSPAFPPCFYRFSHIFQVKRAWESLPSSTPSLLRT